MSHEIFEKVRSRRVRYDPREGDVLVLHAKGIPYDFHIKVIVPHVRSNNSFLEGTTLLYVYAPHKSGGSVMHVKSSFFCIAAYHFYKSLPCEFEFIGSEPVFTWEKEVDIGFSRWAETVKISEYEREVYSQDHDFITSEEGELLAVPFYDAYNEPIDHVPHIKMNGESYATLRGVLDSAESWLRKNKII